MSTTDRSGRAAPSKLPLATSGSFTNQIRVSADLLLRQIQPIFNANCTSCHSGGGAPERLDLGSGKSYSNLVNVTSLECGPTLRVMPGMPNMSYLVFKLQGSGACFSGGQMPLDANPLSAAQQSTISTWISQGAPNN